MAGDCSYRLKIAVINKGYLGIDVKSLPPEIQEAAKEFDEAYYANGSYSHAVSHRNFEKLGRLEKGFCNLSQQSIPTASKTCTHVFSDLLETPEVQFTAWSWSLSNAMLFKDDVNTLEEATDPLFARAQQLVEKINLCGNSDSHTVAARQLEALRMERAERKSKILARKQ